MNRLTISTLGLMLLTIAPAPADDVVEAGRALVKMYCTDCHATEMTGEVTGVDFTGSEPVLIVGTAKVNLSAVLAVRQKTAADQQPPAETTN